MHLYQYFSIAKGFRYDMDTFLEQIPVQERVHLGSPFSIQPVFLKRKNLHFIYGTERFKLFILALYYSLLFQEVMRSSFPEHEKNIPSSSIFPGYWGPCDSFCRERLHPKALLPQKGDLEEKEIYAYITQAQPDMRSLSERLLKDFQIDIDHKMFWRKMMEELRSVR